MEHDVDPLEPEDRLCRHCAHELRLGVDVVAVRHGVIGPRDFVPIEDADLFCGEACVAAAFDQTDVLKFRRRVP